MARRRREHWMMSIADEVRQRANAMVDQVALGIKDTVPFGRAPEPAPKIDIGAFLQADPETRQAWLTSQQDYSGTVTDLMNQANNRFGPSAAMRLAPLFQMSQMAGSMEDLRGQAADPSIGVSAAQADLVELLGVDPFQP